MAVTLNGSFLKEGDFAGLCALQGCYAFIGLTRENGNYYLVVHERNRPETSEQKENYNSVETAKIPVQSPFARLRLLADFRDRNDSVEFSYQILPKRKSPSELNGGTSEFQTLGQTHKLYFLLDHFTGCRVGLFLYSTKETGGSALFAEFSFEVEE